MVGGEPVLARAVRILSVFEPGRAELGVAEIARASGLHVATASRLVGQLVEQGLLTRTGSGRLRIGMRLWELGQRASPTLTLRAAALPFLGDLHAVVGHHVQLGVLDGDEVIFLERLSAPGAVVNLTRIAGRLPLHVSSSGLVLLAHAPPEQQERVLAAPLERRTPATVTDPDRLRVLLARVRRDGHVVTEGHVHPDATGVAVPVRGRDGAVVAALSTVQPHDGRARTLVPALRAAAHGIARAHGGKDTAPD
ncbi:MULTISPECIES: IclR family transcriptional regulator [Pseudonocardia]|uniref:IclR family transcriptional regulator n=1 Tax=Pseudonocardia alni TaxID=33907 RepID=A0AA44ZRY9_PSEA5|nr:MULTISPECIES: IclR family transcriptional regulator [Pseudonocardia]MCO7193917.1 IclR family transcriptional regulator [Pseudonocardia sp. McavD-2-B]PKB33472.1 IclR family transcriptional regulator [Pseudonocardia alni]